MHFDNHVLFTGSDQEREQYNTLIEQIYSLSGLQTYMRTNTAINDNTYTLPNSYGDWINKLQLMTEAMYTNDTDAPSSYVKFYIKNINAYPNDRDWCYRHDPTTERVRSSTLFNKAINTVRVCVITRGMGYFDYIDANYENSRQHKSLESMLTLERNQKVRIITIAENQLVIYTNRFNLEFMHTLVRLRTALFPRIAFIGAEDSPSYQLVKAAHDEDAANIYEVVKQSLAAFVELQSRTLWSRLQTAQNTAKAQEIKAVTDRLTGYNRNLQSYEENYRRTLDAIQQEEMHLTTLKTMPDADIEPLKNALERCQNVQLADVTNDGCMILHIKTPISNYRRADVEMWYKHPESVNSVTRRPAVAKVLKELFLDNPDKYQLLVETRVSVPIAAGRNWNRTQQVNEMANPHIKYFNCFRQSQLEADKALAKRDYDTAIAIIISACSTITFTDSTVVSRMVDCMSDMMATNNQERCIKILETGECVTLNEFQNRINNTEEVTEE